MAGPGQKFLDNALFVVDASGYIFRAYYGMQNPLSAPDGTPTHATYAFAQMIRALAAAQKTKKLVLVWDRKEPSFRKGIYDLYKANRTAPPEDLSIQIENTQSLMKAWGFPQLSVAGFEADDVIASLVVKTKDPVVIVTADKDLLQLVNDNVWCLDTRKNQWSNHDQAVEKFGVEPGRIIDIQSIMGDSSDNIPGAPGIGPKGAADLIQHFGSLEKVLQTATERKDRLEEKFKDPLSGKKLKSVAENIDQILLSKKLVTLSTDVPVEDILLEIIDPDENILREEFQRLGFKRFLDELDAKSTAVNSPRLEVTKSNSIYTAIESISDLKRVLAEASLAPHIAFDTETFSLDVVRPDHMVGFSLAWKEGFGSYGPLRHQTGTNLPIGETRELLQKFLNDKKFIFHNGKFDFHQLANEKIDFKADYEDTILASFLIDVTASHNLENLAERHLGVSTTRFSDIVGKGENFSHVPIGKAAHYAAEDAELTLNLWKHFELELRNQNLWKIYEEVDRPLVRVLYEMERTGVSLDSNYLNLLYRELEKERFKEEEIARDILKFENIADWETLNLSSTKQLGRVLFEDLKLPVIKKNKTGPSTDVDVLEELGMQHAFPKRILEIRELSKLLSTYIEPLPTLVNKETQRLHTSFSQTIAQTGRLASSDPNLQNIPIRTERGARIRKAFIAAEGYSLYSADYSQIELRFLAEASMDPELKRAFKDGSDIHTRTAALVLGKDESEITGDERRSAKAINFGIVYGQTPFGLAKALGISRAEAARFIANYFKSYPNLRDWMEGAVEEAKQSGEVKTLCGRKRKLENIHSKNFILKNFSERLAVNSPLQGTAADLMKLAMIRVSEWIRKSRAPVRMVLQIHDELLFEVKNGFEKEFYPVLKKLLEDPGVFESFTHKKIETPLATDHGYGPNWGELKDID